MELRVGGTKLRRGGYGGGGALFGFDQQEGGYL